MKLPSIKDIDVKGRRVILRASLNVPMEDGVVEDDFRIKHSLPTINLLRERGAKVIIISHISEGRANSLKPVADYLNIAFSPKIFGSSVEEKISQMQNGDALVLENLRIDEGEEKNDINFIDKLAKLGDIFVNDDFSASHREHSSIVGLPTVLPSYAGLQFQEELTHLHSAFDPEHPFLLILGGIKFETKLGVLDKFLEIADKIFIGGALANNFFKGKGIDVGQSAFDGEIDISKYLNNPKIILPVDTIKKDGVILDCGKKTIEQLKELITEAKFVLWNGPLGDFEEGYEEGTEDLAKIIARDDGRSIIGGGDTVAAVKKLKLYDKFTFVSTAGGAMLEFLAEGTLPGIEALK